MTSASYELPETRDGRPLRIVLIAGEPVFRSGFRTVVGTSVELVLVADAPDARAGFRAVDAERPDVVVIDVALPGMDGISATREVKRRAPGARVLLIAPSPRERDVLEGFAAGADGFALKTESVEALLQALRSVGRGTRYLSPAVSGATLDRVLAAPRSGPASSAGSSGAGGPGAARAATVDVLDVLSPREREVLELVLKGWRNREIGRELCVSIKTVDTHRTRINRKLGCRSAGDLIRFAAANGLLDRAPVPRTAPRPSQTIVLVVDDVPELRTWLLDDMRAQGYQQRRAPTLSGAVAELAGLQTAAVFLVDGDQAAAARPAVRAVALLPDADAGERFVAALDRAADGSYAHASGANGVPAPGANVSAA